MANTAAALNIFQAIGAEAAVRRLVHRFFELMDELPESRSLRRLYPEDLSGSEQSLFEALSRWLGGPSTGVLRQNPARMRARRPTQVVAPSERDQWLLCMRLALVDIVDDIQLRDGLIHAFGSLAEPLMNTPEIRRQTSP